MYLTLFIQKNKVFIGYQIVRRGEPNSDFSFIHVSPGLPSETSQDLQDGKMN